MLNFKIIHSEGGTKYVLNLASIDAITFYQDDTATIQAGAVQISVGKKVAEDLVALLGATA